MIITKGYGIGGISIITKGYGLILDLINRTFNDLGKYTFMGRRTPDLISKPFGLITKKKIRLISE